MRKEVIFAIIMGSALGLVVAFGIWRANSAIQKRPNTTNSPQARAKDQSSSPTSTPQRTGLLITKPEKFDVLTESSVSLIGLSAANGKVVISDEAEDLFVSVDSKGEFNQEIKLIGGLNEVVVFSFDKSGRFLEENTLLLVYSKEFPTTDSEENQKDASSEADSVRQKVADKLATATNHPTSFIGVVTDKTETTLEIKDVDGEIKQISITEATSYAKSIKTTTNITFKEVAIGDFIIAMGVKSNGGALTARRVLVTETFEKRGDKALYGKVMESSTKEITITNQAEGKNYKIKPTTRVKVTKAQDAKTLSTKLSDVEENDVILAVGVYKNDLVEASSIHIVAKAPKATSTAKPASTPKAN